MPGVSGKMIRRRLDKYEKERLNRKSCSQSNNPESAHNYSRVPTEDTHIEASHSVHQSEVSPRGVVRKPMQRDLSAINEENCNPAPASIASTYPIQKAVEFCKSVKRLALHSS
uniref:Uncharacterized protein n=1 Tax=Cryptomonas curvata TaxID=233186 RepID=A0A7S0QFW7_9CRYP|mmetsp:Transcript_2076/g.4271  ORF Transcript_2076/g.4271 Transcript_2076/m.4271 type:complete len:113 (+) Transcript_2076:25-363(+)